MAQEIITGKVLGLQEVMKNIQAAFPKDPNQQRKLIQQGMRASLKNTVLAGVKKRALALGGSGALSESMGLRAIRKARLKTSRAVAGVQIVSVRNNMKAVALYANHYYAAKGKAVPMRLIASGIRHAHLVEFGHETRGGGFVAARSFLWPSVQEGRAAYMRGVGTHINRKMESAIKRRGKNRGFR